MQRVNIYKTLDHIYITPTNPVYDDIIKDGVNIGVRLTNPIHIPMGSFVAAEMTRIGIAMIYDKYPTYQFLLRFVGKIHFTNLKKIV